MSPKSRKRRVQFRAPKGLVDRADTLAAAFKTDRMDTLISALRGYPRDVAHSDKMRQKVAETHCDDAITFRELKSLAGHREVANFRLLKQQLSEVFVDDVAGELVDIQTVRIVANTSAPVSLGAIADAATNPLDLLLKLHELLPPKQALEELAETASYDDASGERQCSVKYWIAF